MGYIFYLAFTVLLISTWIWTVNASTSTVLVQKNDVTIADIDGALKCDRILCPKNALLCHVLKESDPVKPTLIRRTNTCFAKDGTMLFQAQKWSLAKDANNVYLDIIADRDGLLISNEEFGSSFHFTTKNMTGLRGKLPGYIKSIANNIAETRAIVSKRLNDHWHKEKVQVK